MKLQIAWEFDLLNNGWRVQRWEFVRSFTAPNSLVFLNLPTGNI